MLRKSISWTLTLALLLSCTVFASAESFTVSEYAGDPVLRTMDAAKLNEAKEAVIATLPEDMQNKEFRLASCDDVTGKNFVLISKRYADASEVQQLIDDGSINQSMLPVPEGYTAKIQVSDAILPVVETAEGEFVNNLSGVILSSTDSSYTTVNQDSGWKPITSDNITLSVRVFRSVYINNSSPLDVLERPITVWGTYTKSGSHTARDLNAFYSGDDASVVKFPDYFDGDYTVVSTGYYLDLFVSSPTSGQTYQKDANFPYNRAINCSISQDLIAGAIIFINDRRLDIYVPAHDLFD